MDNLELIAAYFEGILSAEEKKNFEKKIIEEPQFAEAVSFYVMTSQVAAAEIENQRAHFRNLYEQYKLAASPTGQRSTKIRTLWRVVAAAAVLAGIVFGAAFWLREPKATTLAEQYISRNFENLSVDMGTGRDSLQVALDRSNKNDFMGALSYLENMAADSSSHVAVKYAGIVSLRMGEFDKAITYFSRLENYHLHANPGKFYHALTLLKRNRPGDKQQARILLEQVVENDLEERSTAQQWLEKW